MRSRISANTTIGMVAVIALVLVAIFVVNTVSPAPTALARAESLTLANPYTVTVVGEGTVSIQPDIATASIGVEVVRPTVREASQDAHAVMEVVQAALLSQSLDKADIQTTQFSIYAERFGPGGLVEEDEVRYRVSNTVFITIRDLDSIGDILDAAIEAGANNIYGVDFSLSDPASFESEARAQAVADAYAKASELAELIDVTVGPVVGISEIIGQGGGFFGGGFSTMAGSVMRDGPGSITPGELNLTLQLQVTYGLR